MKNELTWYGDQNYAIRQAIKRATEEILDEVYNWDEDKTARSYWNLVNGKLTIDWLLKNPSDIEPSH